MTFLYDWIKQIVLFILIGTILEMLLPSNSLKKYVHFVFGLLFLLILAKPIFYLFQTDITKEIMEIEKQMQPDHHTVESTMFYMEKQKEDIQAEQVAYIWNELALNMISEVNDTLQQQYDMQIKDLSFENEFDDRVETGEFSKIIVSLEPYENNGENSFEPIEPIVIKQNEKSRQLQTIPKEKAIEKTLRETWQLEDDVTIEIKWEGGTH